MAIRIAVQNIRNKKKPITVTVVMVNIGVNIEAGAGVVPSVGLAVIAANIPTLNILSESMAKIEANGVVAGVVTVASASSIMAICACSSSR
ncbi:hypothetical protein [Brucella haematophila]|uniref:Uncharacterized protein n=1 Tax=Brucella haematophila TaxID=419474 RepID=A0ABX1DNP9_9HYPH|nr:hypothetical protein [Brucella haematophila]NKC04554.1 hypothetical protein [Brucella haematophila]